MHLTPENHCSGYLLICRYVDETKTENSSTQTKVAIVQADGRDDLENDVNLGDEGDIWKQGGSKDELSDLGYPNTKSRRTGKSSGIRIYNFSTNGSTMTFSIEGIGPEAPTPSPNSSPTIGEGEGNEGEGNTNNGAGSGVKMPSSIFTITLSAVLYFFLEEG